MPRRSAVPGIWTIHVSDAVSALREIPDESVNCIVTSPPYWGLRDYGQDGQIGLEPTLDDFMTRLLEVFQECHRVLRADGTMWVNMGDSYAGSGNSGGDWGGLQQTNRGSNGKANLKNSPPKGIKPKSLIGQPWRLAFALQDAGWVLRSDIIWQKPNPMPESVQDRPTRAHEYIFMLIKSGRYWYDADAIRTEPQPSSLARWAQDIESQAGSSRVPGKTNGPMKAVGGNDKQRGHSRRHAGFNDRWDAMTKDEQQAKGANARSVWSIATAGYKGAHFATFPPELPRRCILAGCPIGGVVLDPFAGSGTTLAVAVELGRRAIGIELNPEYADLAVERLNSITPSLFMEESA